MHKKKLRHDHKLIHNHRSFKCAISDLRPKFQDSTVSLIIYDICDFLFIYMKLKNLGKQANYIPNYIYKKENTKGHSNIVSSNKRDPIQISYVVFGQLQV